MSFHVLAKLPPFFLPKHGVNLRFDVACVYANLLGYLKFSPSDLLFVFTDE